MIKKMAFCAALMLSIAGASVFARGKQQQQSGTPAGTITVRLLTDSSGIDDKSFNAAAWRGILEFYGDTWTNTRQRGGAYDVVVAQTQDMYIPNLQQATDEQYDLIVTAGFTFADALTEVATGNPSQKYMILDVDSVKLPNVLEALFAEHEGSYLVGVVAALKAQADGIENPKFGFIGGIPGGTITKFEVGFVQGVLAILPDAQIVDYYVNSWSEPGLAKTQAKTWYDSGVYAIYSAAGSSGNGTIAQAKEYRIQGKNIWAIGVDSDQHEEGLYTDTESAVLTSMIKRVESGVLYGLKAVKNNTFKGEVITLGVKAAGVGYSTMNPAITADIQNQVETIKEQIISGQISVVRTHAEAQKLNGFPQDLKALD
ncbi:MAG: BMP family ABC transporter substrate-binding protein [Spirochaetaceae bacterium]|jgi:basic membrane protein A|nr:BMP family ABC transporter substrate-binding protein [Spirochaetaceae bacterium]